MNNPALPRQDPGTDPWTAAAAAAARLAQLTGVPRHDLAVVLGSGWSAAADLLGEDLRTFPATEVPGFARPAVAGHTGMIRSVRLGATGAHALVLNARTHLYEGLGVRAVAHGVRTAAAAGCRAVVLTNGCGSLVPDWVPGTVVLIRDHLNLTGRTPLEGPRFVDLTDLYSPRLRAICRSVAPDLPEGVYAQFHGPQYETPAEVSMAGILGAHLVGMSTAVEAIAARDGGMEVLGLSLVTNLAAGVSGQPLDHAEVLATGAAATSQVSDLLSRVLPLL